MKKKYLRKFIALFDLLPEAAGILSGKYDDNVTEKDILSSKVSTAYLAVRDIIEDPENRFLTKVFDEIDDNLYEFHSCCEKYIKDLLSGFAGIAPFLVFSPFLESVNFDDESCPDEVKHFASLYMATLSLIAVNDNSVPEVELTVAENYIISCSGLLQNFSISLDARCLRFDLDLLVIQEELNIYIHFKRDIETLALSGYLDIVRQLVSKEKNAQTALPGAQSLPLSLMNENPSGHPELKTVANNTDKMVINDQINPLTLESVFADSYRYNLIMKILVERKLCQPETYIWIDQQKGYKNHIVSILKYLYFQNYYKSKAGISNHQIRQIALNTFGVQISIDTIKHAEISSFNLDFIPEASTIKENHLKISSGNH